MPTLSFIVPCHDEEAVLPLAIPRLLAAGAATNESFEIVLIDDGSTDRTWELIADAATRDPEHVRGIRFTHNFGQHAAMLAGLQHARGDHALLVDADLQDPPELAAPMLARAWEGYDIVTGVRRSRAGEPWPKRATAWMFHRALNLVAPRPIPVDSGYFYLLSRRALDRLLALPARDRYLRLLVSLIDLPRVAFPYDRAPRLAGHTHYSYARLCGVAWHAFASCLRRPAAGTRDDTPRFEINTTTS
ncbi:MAG: glycosyltransferase family 2 protein [Opitutaceae bacterium]|nr:glycosyltransferase family 2 protein [Opitutaceae bacterium]